MKILIIGNATTVAEHNTNDYDIVCRLNYGISDGDCDYWFNGAIDSKQQLKFLGTRNYKKHIRVYNKPSFMRMHPDLPNTEYVDISITSKYGLGLDGSKPSTGYSATRYMLDKYPDAQVYLVGFDWYETPNRYINKGLDSNHDMKLEKAILGVIDRVTVLK